MPADPFASGELGFLRGFPRSAAVQQFAFVGVVECFDHGHFVWSSVGTSLGTFEGAIEFGVAVGRESTSRTRDELVNAVIARLLLMPDLTYSGAASFLSDDVGVLNGVNNVIFDNEISMAPCSTGLDNPDIEHYRRMAEQATALPDTL